MDRILKTVVVKIVNGTWFEIEVNLLAPTRATAQRNSAEQGPYLEPRYGHHNCGGIKKLYMTASNEKIKRTRHICGRNLRVICRR